MKIRPRFAETATIAIVATVTASCISLPLKHHRFDRIVCVSWSDGQPVALAQDSSVYQGAYPLTPDGPGVFEFAHMRDLVIVTPTARYPVSYIPRGTDSFDVTDAVARPSHRDFLVKLHFLSRATGNWAASSVLVNLDGRVTEIERASELGSVAFSHDGTRILFGDFPDFKSYDLQTHAIEPVTSQLERIRLVTFVRELPDWFPCFNGSQYDSLSPDGTALAFPCCPKKDVGGACGLWATDALGHYRYLAPASPRPPSTPPEPLDTTASWPREEHSLSWANQHPLLYWCDHSGGQGLIIDVSNPSAAPRRAPCLLLASWSPDDTRIAGVVDMKLVVHPLTSD